MFGESRDDVTGQGDLFQILSRAEGVISQMWHGKMVGRVD